MVTVETLFFELLQVATGQLDCLTRGPEADEWKQLHELSKRHHVEGVAYHGLMRLFEFGLRAPQDVSLDWMADAEEISERNELQKKQPAVVRFYSDDLKQLRQIESEGDRYISRFTIYELYDVYKSGQLDMRTLMDYFFTLQMNGDKYETLQGGGLLGRVGIRRFASGMMWLMAHTLLLPEQAMPFQPLEAEGRYLLSDMMGHQPRWMHIRHRWAWFQF